MNNHPIISLLKSLKLLLLCLNQISLAIHFKLRSITQLNIDKTQHAPTPINLKSLTFARLEEDEEAKEQPRITTSPKVLQRHPQMTPFTPQIVPKHHLSPKMTLFIPLIVPKHHFILSLQPPLSCPTKPNSYLSSNNIIIFSRMKKKINSNWCE